jgi:hypothetical protein
MMAMEQAGNDERRDERLGLIKPAGYVAPRIQGVHP